MKLIITLCILAPLCSSEFTDHHRVRRQHQQGHQADQQINYRPLSHAPANIQKLLQIQNARDPIVNIPVQKPPQLRAPEGKPQYTPQSAPQVANYNPQVQYGHAPEQPTYKNIQPKPVAAPQYQQPAAPQYQPRQPQYPQYRGHGGQQGGQGQQPNYKAIYRPVSGPQQQEALPQYSKQLPPQLQQLIQNHRP